MSPSTLCVVAFAKTLEPLLNMPDNAENVEVVVDARLLTCGLLDDAPPLPKSWFSTKSSGDRAGTAHLQVENFGPSTEPLHRKHVSFNDGGAAASELVRAASSV